MKLHPRTILRLAGGRRARPAPGMPGMRALSSRTASAPVEWMLDEAYNLPFLNRGHAGERVSVPVPVPSSSKMTLDILGMDPHADRGISHTHEVEDELPFADDADLLAALSDTSGRLLPPSAAYRALRQSPLFGAHLQALVPRIAEVYSALRNDNAGAHDTLVSDLLLREPSPTALRAILLEEVKHFPEHWGDALHQGLIVQAYRVILPALRRRALAPLTPGSLAVVARALMAAGHAHLDILEHVYYQLAHAASWTREDGWPALAILLHYTKHGRAEQALKLLDYPVSLGKLPAAMGRTTASHAEPATLLAQSAVVRCALYWGIDVRAYAAVNDLVTTMSRTAVSGPALDLVLAAVRGASVRHRPADVAWAGRTLVALASDDAFPPLPAINWYYAALSPAAAIQFYTALPENRAVPPSPRQILRMALARPERPALRRLASDLVHAPHASPVIPGVLRALATARLLRPAQAVYAAWRSHHALDGATTLAMVRAFTRGARTHKNSQLARAILADYLASPALDRDIVALHAHALLGPPVEREGTENREEGLRAQADLDARLAALIARRGPAAQDMLDALASQHPSLAHRLAEIAGRCGLTPPRPAVVLAASCVAGHWGALASADVGGQGPLAPTAVERACLSALNKARRGRMLVASQGFVEACAEDARARGIDFDAPVARPTPAEWADEEGLGGPAAGPTAADTAAAAAADPVIPPTAAALLRRAAAVRAWDAGFRVLCAALRVTGEEGVVEAASVFVSGVGKARTGGKKDRENGRDDGESADRCEEAVAALAAHADEVLALVRGLETGSCVLLETMLETAGRRLGVPVILGRQETDE